MFDKEDLDDLTYTLGPDGKSIIVRMRYQEYPHLSEQINLDSKNNAIYLARMWIDTVARDPKLETIQVIEDFKPVVVEP